MKHFIGHTNCGAGLNNLYSVYTTMELAEATAATLPGNYHSVRLWSLWSIRAVASMVTVGANLLCVTSQNVLL